MGSLPRVGLVLSLMTLLAVGVTEAQEGLTQRHSQGPVTVAVTLMAAPATGAPITVRVALDTHSVGLDGIAFEKAVAEAKGGGHHREALLAVRDDGARAGRPKIPFDLHEIDIQSTPGLYETYKERIPLVVINGRPAFKFRVNEAALRRRLAREGARQED